MPVRRLCAEPEPDPEQVAGYKIVKLLGRGGMGSVYEAEDSHFGRRVALKLIAADHVASAEAVERFRQEGRLASTIAHPRCVFVLAADEEAGRPYIVMELMPGETLQTLIDQRGTLPLPEAIAKVLDIIDGLQEAHIQGVIHRDVKPSNCFLESDGRVKVGDFGLSKSLEVDAQLTRTGAFIGTPLYASPEQIKRDDVDARTDVYSVAATLYFLLAGKPPFEAGDAAATLARIVSEPPTPLRKHRPDLPAALEAAVLRGLERDRDRRWQDLSRLRDALLPFVSDRMRLCDQALRVSAYHCRFVACFRVVFWAFVMLTFAVTPTDPERAVDRLSRYGAPVLLGFRGVAFLYFTVLEGLWGASLGKRLTRLRVRRVEGGGPPGLAVAAARSAAFYALSLLPGDLVMMSGQFGHATLRGLVLLEPISQAMNIVGLLVMASTMRAANGYRGTHEWLTGTRVVRMARASRLRAPRGRRLPNRPERYRAEVGGPVGVLRSVGPFHIRGAVRWDGERRVLLGEDSTLERPVWIVIRPKGSPPPSQARRALGRPSRPRWLTGGEQAEGRWDAYAAPMGCTLADLAGPLGLPWGDARPILSELVDELAKACAEGTLPEALSTEQVWIQPDGSVQLVDPIEPTHGRHDGDTQERALALLRSTSALILEGGRRRGTAPPTSIRAAVPEHAARKLDRLIGRPRAGDTAYVDVASLAVDLEADRDQPTEIDLPRRAAHLVPAAFTLVPLLSAAFYFTKPTGAVLPYAWAYAIGLPAYAWAYAIGLPAIWVVWSLMTRGGYLLRLAGVSLVRTDSRPAEHWRCAWRALVVWTPLAALLAGATVAREHAVASSSSLSLAWLLWVLAALYLIACPIIALVFPARSVHDRLAGTYLVPK